MGQCRRQALQCLTHGGAMSLAVPLAAAVAGMLLTAPTWAQGPGASSTETNRTETGRSVTGAQTGSSESLVGNPAPEKPLPDQVLSEKPVEERPPAPSPAAVSTPSVAPAPAPLALPVEKAAVPSIPAADLRTGLRLSVQSGAHLAAQQKAIHAPYVAQTGTAITVVPWPADGNPLKEASTGKPAWDLAEVDLDKARQACDGGLIERIDIAVLAKSLDSAAPEKDYIMGGLTPCAIASASWSSLIAFDQRAWPAQSQAQAARGAKRPKTAPATAARTPDKLKDVFDVVAFPGKRAFRRGPRYLLEMSLIADGVAPEDVYRLLAGEEGTTRAFVRLEALRGQINWVDTPAAASRQLADRSAVMAMVYSGRAFQNVAVEGKAQGLIWEGQLYHLDAWVVAKGAPPASTRAFLGIASDPAHLAAQATLFPYGPPRASAVAKVGRHPVLKTEMASYLPTAPANLRTALQFDARFWDTHERRLSETFAAWLKAPLTAPIKPPEPSPAASASEPPSPNSGPNSGSTSGSNGPPAVPTSSSAGKSE
jgi:putative spermidine/putrescine transport system substrate-binding protein